MVLNRKLLIGSGAAAVIMAGGIYGGVALAQASPTATSTSTPAATSTTTTGTSSPKPNGQAGQVARQNYLQHLASRLNVSVDALTSAMKGAGHDSVADAVKAGTITQAQADKINQRIDSGQGGPFLGVRPLGPHPGGPNGFGPGARILPTIAKALNLQPADLMSQLRSGKSLSAIASAQNVSLSTVSSAVKAQLDPLVSSNKMTATQESNILQRISSGNLGGPRGPHGPRPNNASPKPSA